MRGRADGIVCRGCGYRPQGPSRRGSLVDSHIDAHAVFVNCCPHCGLRPVLLDRVRQPERRCSMTDRQLVVDRCQEALQALIESKRDEWARELRELICGGSGAGQGR